jgi:metallo-beta-lactamase class B
MNMVFADSLNAVSATGFRFTDSPLPQAFEKGFAILESLPCDILLAAHPAPAQVFEKLAARDSGKADAFIDSTACKTYVETARKNLATRLAAERRR